MENRTYVYGGAFDPITVAHEAIIFNLLECAAPGDSFLFAVTDNDEKKYSCDIAERKAMLQMVVNKYLASLRMEGKIDTNVVVQRVRTCDFLEDCGLLNKSTTLVLGMDEWADLATSYRWKDADRLKENLEFQVYDRWTAPGRIYRRVGFGTPGLDVRKVPMNLPPASSTEVRELLRFDQFAAPATVSPDVMHYIAFHGLYGQTEPEQYVAEAKDFVTKYSAGEYPKPSVTATMVIHTNKEILLVRRKDHPFKGYWCLPGGFAEPYEDIETVALRELEEETGLNERSGAVSRMNVHQLGVFTPDDPRFSREKGTWGYDVALSINVGDVGKCMAHPGDDAVEAEWVDFETAGKVPLAFHHRAIVEKFMKQFKPEGTIVRDF